MTKEFWFWLIMFLWFLFGLYVEYIPGQPYPYPRGARHFMMFLLFVIIGLSLFGSPVK